MAVRVRCQTCKAEWTVDGPVGPVRSLVDHVNRTHAGRFKLAVYELGSRVAPPPPVQGELPLTEQPASKPVQTSVDAARSIAPVASQIRQLVWEALRDTGGLTAEALEGYLGISGNTIRPRLRELEKEGRAYRTDRTALTISGRQAYVWFAESQRSGS